MKSLPYVISKKAISDLEEIWYHTVQKWSADQANRYYDLILEKVNHICEKPDSGKSFDHIRKGYRASKVKSHIIFYKVVNDSIEVIRVLHERMDIESRLIE